MSRTALITALLVALMLVVPSTALAAKPVWTFKLFAQGALFMGDTCPTEAPAVATECEFVAAGYFKEDAPEGGHFPGVEPDGRRIPFYLFIYHEDIVVYPDGSFEISATAWGVTYDTAGTYDKTKLASASVEAAVPMSDGSTFVVDLQWTAVTEIEKYGNDGPLSEFNGDPARHYGDDCTTANFNDHMKFRFATISGNLGGTSASDFLSFEAGVINNWFHWMEVTHGNCR